MSNLKEVVKIVGGFLTGLFIGKLIREKIYDGDNIQCSKKEALNENANQLKPLSLREIETEDQATMTEDIETTNYVPLPQIIEGAPQISDMNNSNNHMHADNAIYLLSTYNS